MDVSRAAVLRPRLLAFLLPDSCHWRPAVMRKGMGTHLVNAPLKFAPPSGVAFFEALGWRVAEVHSIFHAAVRFRLAMVSKTSRATPRAQSQKAGQSALVRRRAAYAGRLTPNGGVPRRSALLLPMNFTVTLAWCVHGARRFACERCACHRAVLNVR